MVSLSATYDAIGVGYRDRRLPDRRIAAQIVAALGDARTVVNVGAGAGSYEPRDRGVVAVEPAATMIAQRPEDAAPVVTGVAEHLPLPDDAFDAALAVLTLHHWTDLEAGLRELARVANARQVIVTWDQRVSEDTFWFIRDYAPEMMPVERAKCPSLAVVRRVLGDVRAEPLLIPADCTDGFFAAYWRRPEVYLDDRARESISAFALIEPWRYEDGLHNLERDLTSGRWHDRYGDLLDRKELDCGYRLLVATPVGPR